MLLSKVMLSWSSAVLGISSLAIPREVASQFNLMQYNQWCFLVNLTCAEDLESPLFSC